MRCLRETDGLFVLQTDFIRQMHAHFVEMQRICPSIRTPYFEAIILHTDESIAIERQRGRAAAALAQNAAAMKGGSVPPEAVRESDLCELACGRRYTLYEASLPRVLQLREKIPVHLVDCSKSPSDNRDAIARALMS